MNIKLIRMHSGEDVVANLIEEKENTTVIENPIVAIPTGNSHLGFAPWSPILNKSQKQLEIKSSYIVYIAEVDDSVVEQYEKMFSTISKPPSKKLIL